MDRAMGTSAGESGGRGPTGRLLEADRSFVERRARLTRTWPAVGSVVLLGLGGLVVWLFATNSLLVNPVRVAQGIESGGISDETLAFMAGLLPVAVLTSIVVVFAVLVLSFKMAANERRHIEIIEALWPADGVSDRGRSGEP